MSALNIVIDGYSVGYENDPVVAGYANSARAELAALRARCERAEAELNAVHVYLDESLVNNAESDDQPLKLLDRIADVVNQLTECRVERDALRDNVICRFCGASYPIGAEEPNHWRTCKASPIAKMIDDLEGQLNKVASERDAKNERITELAAYAASLDSQLKMYQRQEALRQ